MPAASAASPTIRAAPRGTLVPERKATRAPTAARTVPASPAAVPTAAPPAREEGGVGDGAVVHPDPRAPDPPRAPPAVPAPPRRDQRARPLRLSPPHPGE